MFAKIQRLLSIITVKEQNNLIYITGLPVNNIVRNIYNQWNTSKITEHMFTKVTDSSICFNSFFAIDFLYALETICKERPKYVNIRAVRKVIDELRANTWLKDINSLKENILNRDCLKQLNVSLLPQQENFLDIYEKNVKSYNLKGYLLAAEPGTGKTISTLAVSLCLEADLVICVVPKNSLNKVWEDTLVTRFKEPQSYWISNKEDRFIPGKKYYVLHYERLVEAVEFFKDFKCKKPVVILDECHNLNDMDSLRTQKFIELCSILNTEHVLWASGTPIKAIGNEAMPLLMTIDKLFNKDALERFKKIFGKNASKAVDILRNRIGLVSFKVSKKDTVTHQTFQHNKNVELPNSDIYTLDFIKEEMRTFVKQRLHFYRSNMDSFVKIYEECLDIYYKTIRNAVELEQFKTYKKHIALIRTNYNPETMMDIVVFCNKYELEKIVPSLPNDLKGEFKHVRSIVKYHELKVRGEALGGVLGKKRTECHVQMVRVSKIEDEINASIKKTIIFTSYVEVVKETEKYLTGLGFKPLVVYGDTNKDLTKIVEMFDKDIDANPLIATYQSLSTAVPLTMANTVICMNSPFRHHELEQAIARASRIGQTEDVNVFHVLLDTGNKPNISTRSNDILKWSEEMVSAIMGTSNSNVIAVETIVDKNIRELFGAKETSNAPKWLTW